MSNYKITLLGDKANISHNDIETTIDIDINNGKLETTSLDLQNQAPEILMADTQEGIEQEAKSLLLSIQAIMDEQNTYKPISQALDEMEVSSTQIGMKIVEELNLTPRNPLMTGDLDFLATIKINNSNNLSELDDYIAIKGGKIEFKEGAGKAVKAIMELDKQYPELSNTVTKIANKEEVDFNKYIDNSFAFKSTLLRDRFFKEQYGSELGTVHNEILDEKKGKHIDLKIGENGLEFKGKALHTMDGVEQKDTLKTIYKSNKVNKNNSLSM